MKRVLIQMPITVIAFWVGVSAVSYFWNPLTLRTQPADELPQTTALVEPARLVPATPQMTAPAQSRTAPRVKSLNSDEYDGFEQIVACLKKLPAFMGRAGKQTFYISAAKDSEFGRFAHAYWEEYDALIILKLPFFGEPDNVSQMYWLRDKAYIDLKQDVVPRMLVGTPLYKVPRAWADKTVRSCKAGYKLKVINSDR